MLTSAYIFRSSENLPGLFHSFFGGLFVLKGVAITLQVLAVSFLFISLGVAAYASRNQSRRATIFSQVLPCVTVFLIGFIFFQPWDELFVNLRHSLNFAEAGKFSFNQRQNLEATVDFLPYFLIGVMGKIGFPLMELALFQSIFGAILCLWAGRALLVAWKIRGMEIWAIPLLALFPPLWFNAGQGFSTTIFSAAILWAIYFLFYSKTKWLGFLLVALIPLIRMEGIWASLLLLGWSQRKKPTLLLPVLSLVPFVLLSIWRLDTFGSIIPLPIQFKNSFGNLFFLGVGAS
jgi:hypothetical protein